MKIRRIAATMLAAVLIASGCSNGSTAKSSEASDTAGTVTVTAESQTGTSETGSVTSEIAEAMTSAEETTDNAPENRASMVDEEPYITHEDYPKKLFTEQFIVDSLKDRANQINEARRDFTAGNTFYDFTLTYDAPSSDIPEDVQKKTVEFAKTTDIYIESMKYTDVFAENETVAEYVTDGVIEPKFHRGYEYDFDGDGNTERFLVVKLPQIIGENNIFPVHMLIFENSGGEMSYVNIADDCYSVDEPDLIDYGDFRQLIFGGEGFYGFRSYHNIYGIENGEVKTLFEGRAGFAKAGCFLYYSGWMGSSGLMIFDTNTHEYRTIHGYPADIHKLIMLDRDKVLGLYELEFNDTMSNVLVFGERYVMDFGNIKCYKYENGTFTDIGDRIMMWYPFLYSESGSSSYEDDYWFDVDMDYALEASGTTIE